ncbi:phosphatase PAP2 family protein [Microvirga arsenatis]|uniref:Phosphatase PAP2 family protein n=1 Tax=Microvirga arsenatis TaxID=2692265 RepID=A0ABW9YYF2_9HYPH|nr:phosphatase PAP2 family protein [Microvirga arsenatis]NBJ11138.1 phosphatase PAP2 family protein [Microvirga arsenatis]NBJ25411.1 phosphatase PAP2 family protein [Microvirga arsenatis]
MGGLGGLAGMNSPASAEALIRTRDGIVGSWAPPGATPRPLDPDHPANLERWEPWVRASIIDFELLSKLGFSKPAAGSMALSHLDTTGAQIAYRPLVTITRPTENMFKKQLVFLDRYADLRGDRASEILSQTGGALTFLSSIAFLHPSRTPWTFELLAAALRLANFAEMRLKHAFACRRPNEFSPQVQPMILTPSHGSYPSGHATESFMAALVLWGLLRASRSLPPNPVSPNPPYGHTSWGTQLMRVAARVAVNRTIAGVHFPIDSAAGAFLGLTLGQYFLNLCRNTGSYQAFTFDSAQFPDPTAGGAPPNDGDFYWSELFDETVPGPKQPLPGYIASVGAQVQSPSPSLVWLWGKAKSEWV